MFDWTCLPSFLELARQGRLGPAAKRLKVDHSTVGRRVAELEKSLAVKLFDRSTDGFVLTEDGHKMLAYAESMENLALSIVENAGQKTVPAGIVRLATMEGIGSFYIAPRLDHFRKQHPSITVELVTSAQILNLTKREADVSLSFVCPGGSRLIVKTIGRFDLKLYGAPAYFKRHGEPKSINDLENHLFVDYIEDLVQISAVRWLHDLIKNPQVVFRSTSMMAQQSAAASGVGLAVLPSFTAAKDTRLKPLLADKTSIKRDLWLSVHEDLREIARVRALTSFLTEIIQHDRDFFEPARCI
jgi:DNA-binding transcriptional LysR family regulator